LGVEVGFRFRVEELGVRVWGLRFKIQGSGFRVWSVWALLGNPEDSDPFLHIAVLLHLVCQRESSLLTTYWSESTWYS